MRRVEQRDCAHLVCVYAGIYLCLDGDDADGVDVEQLFEQLVSVAKSTKSTESDALGKWSRDSTLRWKTKESNPIWPLLLAL